MRRHILFALALLAVAACERQPSPPPGPSPVKMTGPLIAASVSMKAAWEFPRNPLADKTLDKSKLSEEIRRGFRMFTNTPAEAPRLAPGGMSCTNCHMNARPAREVDAARRTSPACFPNTTAAPAGCSAWAIASPTASCAARTRPAARLRPRSCRRRPRRTCSPSPRI